jgi:predicted unusual protein kinase regulating ubiquinone biosynthesis (AarF/ABC1/UbiB family)
LNNILDKDKFSKRASRYIQLTGQVGGLLTKLGANRFLGVNIDKDKHALNLKKDLGEIKGPFMKIAQFISMIPDALPIEYSNQLMQLQSHAPSMGELFVKRRMENELGENWKNFFLDFNTSASYAASLGQVHKAKLKNGDLVACKLQYPDMQSAVNVDLNQLRIILNLFEKYNKAIKTKKIFLEIKDRLVEEIDYENEINNIKIFKKIFEFNKSVNIPKIYRNCSTKRLITMSWLEGQSLDEMLRYSKNKKNLSERIATNIFNTWYMPFYKFCVIHGDPHFGNYSFKKNGDINLFDFGCVRFFPIKFVKAVLNLYYALEKKDEDLMVEAYKTWGFKKINKKLIKVLNLWASYIYGPLLEDKKRLIQGEKKKGYGFDIVNNVYKELRKIGGVEPPKEFVFMDRAAIGMGSLFMKLDVKLNWHNLFKNLIKDFDETRILKERNKIIN